MNEKLAAKINVLLQKAKEAPKSAPSAQFRSRSSLHRVIKTKEQAMLFNKLLKHP